MSDGDALLAAILAHPAEDTPRLAYADWLDEHDEPERARFIRLQINPEVKRYREYRVMDARALGAVSLHPEEARRWGFWPYTTQTYYGNFGIRYRMTDRAFVMTMRHGSNWEGRPRDTATVARGFLSELRCSCDDWFHIGSDLCQRQPITKVTFCELNAIDAGGEYIHLPTPAQALRLADEMFPHIGFTVQCR